MLWTLWKFILWTEQESIPPAYAPPISEATPSVPLKKRLPVLDDAPLLRPRCLTSDSVLRYFIQKWAVKHVIVGTKTYRLEKVTLFNCGYFLYLFQDLAVQLPVSINNYQQEVESDIEEFVSDSGEKSPIIISKVAGVRFYNMANPLEPKYPSTLR